MKTRNVFSHTARCTSECSRPKLGLFSEGDLSCTVPGVPFIVFHCRRADLKCERFWKGFDLLFLYLSEQWANKNCSSAARLSGRVNIVNGFSVSLRDVRILSRCYRW